MVATSRWLYATLRHAGQDEEAAKLLAPLPKDMKVVRELGLQGPAAALQGRADAPSRCSRGATDGIDHPTLGYGVADFYLVNGQKEKALALLREVVAGPSGRPSGSPPPRPSLARQKAP